MFPCKEVAEVREVSGSQILLNQQELKAERDYKSKTHLSIRELTKNLDDQFRQRTLYRNIGFKALKPTESEEQVLACCYSLDQADKVITGQSIIACLEEIHTLFKSEFEKGIASRAKELTVLENVAENLHQVIDDLIRQGALETPEPQSSLTP